MSQGSDNVIHVYPTNPVLQRFDKVKIVPNKDFSRCTGSKMNQSIMEKISNKIAPIDYEALVMEAN